MYNHIKNCMVAKMKKRVVITGMGTINPLGDSLESYYSNLLAGKSGVKKWQSLDMSLIECKIGGDIGDYDIKGKLSQFKDDLTEEKYKKVQKLFRSATFACKMTVLCTLDSVRDAGLLGSKIDPFHTSVIVGGHNLNSNYIFDNLKRFLQEPDWIDPLCSVEALDPNVPAVITEILGIHGPTFTIGGACASGNLALREGYRDIISGECSRAIVAGALFDVSAADIHASVVLNAVVLKPEYQENPEKASRPFDSDRDGFVYSHGTGSLVIEDLETAKNRGAVIHGEVLGVKIGANACHLPAPAAASQERIMRELLDITGVPPEEIDYINCHATGTPVGDLEEIKAIKGVFKDHAYKLKMNAPKSMTGHTCWASSLVETIGAILQMKYGKLHPTINIDRLDPEVDLDVSANRVQEYQIRYILKNSFGFGGINACSLIKRYEE